jgi:hypothetical protein
MKNYHNKEGNFLFRDLNSLWNKLQLIHQNSNKDISQLICQRIFICI